MTIATTVTTSGTLAAAALAVGCLGVLLYARGRGGRSGTTLVAVWRWWLVALVVVGATEALVHVAGPAAAWWRTHARFAAAVTTLAPPVALLGARRPLDRGWQFVVLSLVAIVGWPAVESLAVRPGAGLEVHAARQWFLAALVGLGLASGLPTRGWPSAAAAGLAQALLLADYLPGAAGRGGVAGSADVRGIVGLALWGAAAMRCGQARPRTATQRPLDRLWLEFRDAFGAVWALRIAQRFNAAAAACGWPARLEWRGLAWLESTAGSSPAARAGTSEPSTAGSSPAARAGASEPSTVERAAQAQLEVLLRRFVSPAWIARRVEGP